MAAASSSASAMATAQAPAPGRPQQQQRSRRRRRPGGTASAADADDNDDDEGDDGEEEEEVFTPARRDRQARGKDPYRDAAAADDDDDDAGSGSGSDFGFGFGFDHGLDRRLGTRRGGDDGDDVDARERRGGLGRQRRFDIGHGLQTEPFEERERRTYALAALDSPEQLMMFAQSANDSIPSQRRRFAAILAGFEPLPAAVGPGAGHDSAGEWAD